MFIWNAVSTPSAVLARCAAINSVSDRPHSRNFLATSLETRPKCLPFAQRETASHHQTASTTSKTPCLSLPTRWKTRKMLHMRARSDTRSYGLYFRSVISVCHFRWQEILWLTIFGVQAQDISSSCTMAKKPYPSCSTTGYSRMVMQTVIWLPNGRSRGMKRYVFPGQLLSTALMWKKLQLCCLRCIQTKETNFNATCICRVPQAQLKEDQTIECVSCGCRGCSSADWLALHVIPWWKAESS